MCVCVCVCVGVCGRCSYSGEMLLRLTPRDTDAHRLASLVCLQHPRAEVGGLRAFVVTHRPAYGGGQRYPGVVREGLIVVGERIAVVLPVYARGTECVLFVFVFVFVFAFSFRPRRYVLPSAFRLPSTRGGGWCRYGGGALALASGLDPAIALQPLLVATVLAMQPFMPDQTLRDFAATVVGGGFKSGRAVAPGFDGSAPGWFGRSMRCITAACKYGLLSVDG